MLSNLASKVDSILWRNFCFVELENFELNFSAAFMKEHNKSSLAVQMVDVVENMVMSKSLTRNTPQIYQHYIRMAKFPLQHPETLNIIKKFDREEMKSKTLGISHLDNGTLFTSRIKDTLLLILAASEYVRDRMR